MKKTNLFISAFMVLFSFMSFGQVAGDLSTQTQNFNFQKLFQGIALDPSPNVGRSTQRRFSRSFNNLDNPDSFGKDLGADILASLLEEVGVDVPEIVLDFANGVGTFTGVSVTPTFKAGLNVDYGGYLEVDDIGKSSIAVDYPVEVTITYPEENTFGCGDEFTIQTSYIITGDEDKTMLEVSPPFLEMELGPFLDNLRFEVAFGLKVSACIGVPIPLTGICGGKKVSFDKSFTVINEPIDLPDFLEDGIPVLTVCEDAFGMNNQEADLIACTTGGSSILNFAQDAIDAVYPAAQDFYSFADFPSDNRIVISTPNVPEVSLPEINGSFNRVTSDVLNFQSLNSGRRLKVNGVQSDVSSLEFDLISLIDLATQKIPTSIEYPPLFSLDFGDLSPTFSVDQELNYQFDPVIHITVQLGVEMSYKVVDDVLGEVASGSGTSVDLIAGQKIIAIYPEALSLPTNVSGAYNLDGDFTTLTNAKYYNSYTINVLQLEILDALDVTVFSDVIGKEESTPELIIEDHTFNLTGFDTITLNDFVLDPENPIINIDDVTVEDIINIGGGEREVVYKIVFSNGGDVELRETQIDFNLLEAFETASNLEVRCTFSEDLTVNSSYDGITDIGLLEEGNTIAVGQTSSIELLVRVKPEVAEIDVNGCFETVDYFISAFATATSPIGTSVQNNFYQCTGERTGEDIVAAVDLGAAVIESINDYSIYGWKGVVFDKELAKSYGNVGSTESIRFENVSQKGGEQVVIVGDLHAGNEVFLQGESKLEVDYIQVANAVKIPNRKSSLNETGTTSEFSDCVVTFDRIALSSSNFSGNKYKIKANETLELTPGSYREIRLEENSVLKLSSGVYNIGRWAFMGDNAKVLYNTTNGLIVINIGKWQNLGVENIELSIQNPTPTPNVYYNYTGEQPVKFNNSFVQGQIVAPNAEIEFALSSTFEGSCYADKVNFKTGSSFKGNAFLEQVNINPSCLSQEVIVASDYLYSMQSPIETNVVEVKAFPNPVVTNLQITALNKINEIQVYNFMGQKVIHRQNLNNTEENLNFESLSKGMYFVSIQCEDKNHLIKVMKK